MQEIVRGSYRTPRRHLSQREAHVISRQNIPVRVLPSAEGQRRHASRMSEALELKPPRPTHAPGGQRFPLETSSSVRPRSSAVHQLQQLSKLHTDQFDLESAWDAYNSVSSQDMLSSLAVGTSLALAGNFATAAEKLYQDNTDIAIIHEWGYRIHRILEALQDQIESYSPYDYSRQCLLARSLALSGDLKQAIILLHAADKIPILYAERGPILRAYEGIILSTWRHNDGVHALEFILSEWSNIGSHLTQKASKWHHATPAMIGRSLRETAHAAIASIENPAVLLADRMHWEQARRQEMGRLLIEVLCDQNLPQDALDVFHEMERQRIDVPLGLQLTLVRVLVREDAFSDANSLFRSIDAGSAFKYHLSTGLYLYAHQGDTAQADKYYTQLANRNMVSEHDIAMFLYSYATQGRIEQVHDLFDRFYPEGHDGERLNSPSLLHYSVVIYAHSQRGDFDGINVWLENMTRAGLRPDVYVYSIILKSFALRGDMDSLAAILVQMRAAGVQPNIVTYTTIITLLAHRKDPVGAEIIYRRAIQDGVVPDRRMISSVMNAHVEAGSWKGVIRAFDYLNSSPTRHIRLTIEVYNTLLKAYVLIGAPFRIVSKLFGKLESSHIHPNAYTYALLIQSACDAGQMRVASAIFDEMEREAGKKGSNHHINAYILTILMAGYLRVRDKLRARAVYDEMRERGIQPTSISFGTILKAYGNEKTEEGMELAESFIKTLMEAPPAERAWVEPTHGRKTALEHIYGPIISAYGKQQRVEDVERVFQALLDAGGEPSLGILTMLLDAYRRTHNIDAVVQLWPQIFQLGLRYSRAGPLFEDAEYDTDATRPRLQGNILCVPLSIYIDALSAAGLHLRIATVWKRFQGHKFTFDSHNWNHMAVALIRAGEPERAFEIIEKVILPYQAQSRRLRGLRNQHPDTPLLFDVSPTNQSIDQATHGAPSEPAMHRPRHRAIAAKIATERLPAQYEIDDEEYDDDFAHPLDILHQISPSWNTWHVHRVTLKTLLRAICRLQSGILIEPMKPRLEGELYQVELEQTQEMATRAGEILKKIYTDYPDTIRVVFEHEVKERRRLGERYDRVYNWR